MVNALLNGLMKFIMGFINLLLRPIDSFIIANLPDFSSAISAIVALFTLLYQSIDWVIDSFCIPSFALNFMILSIAFRIYLRVSVSGLKLALNWYEKLMP